MKDRIRLLLIVIYQIIDLAVLAFALWLAFLLGSPFGVDYIRTALTAPNFESTFFFGGAFFSWGLVLSSIWLYRSKRLSKGSDELFDVIRAVGFCTAILATLILLAEWQIFPKRFILIFAAASFLLMLTLRMIKRSVLKQFRLRGRNLRSVVVIGAGERGRKMVRLIEQAPEIGYQFLGFVDDLDEPGVLGGLKDFERVLAENVIDEVFICLPIKTFYDRMEIIAQAAEDQGIIVRVHSDLFNLRLARAVTGEICNAPILSLHAPLRKDWQSMMKTTIDCVSASMLLVALSPLMVLIALFVKLTSPGAVFFIQERVGFNKRLFKMYKFRTMVSNAEALQSSLESLNEAGGPVFKIKNDPRITKIGRFLRKTSLDELPQLFNVLSGDLSLVGPRPLPLRDFEKFEELWFNRRFSVKPGITCIWQISGRSETSFDDWIRQDLEYIDSWSLKLDLKILFMTIPVVLRGTGAM